MREAHNTPAPLRIGNAVFRWGQQTYVMGIINVTPDSFSGDGLLVPDERLMLDAVVRQGLELVQAGADLLDVGGESTRPGAPAVDVYEEMARVVPAIRALRSMTDIPISVDSTKVAVVEAALDAGADLVNDIWGLRQPGGGWNQAMAALVATRQAAIVLMHNRRAAASSGQIGGHYAAVHYDNLPGDVVRELAESIAFAEAQGIDRERIIVDPGIGFGKTPDQNIELLRHLSRLRELGRPVLLGTSRKSFIGRALGGVGPQDRVEGTAATVALGIQAGVDIVRVHDVAVMARVARMADAIVRAGEQ